MGYFKSFHRGWREVAVHPVAVTCCLSLHRLPEQKYHRSYSNMYTTAPFVPLRVTSIKALRRLLLAIYRPSRRVDKINDVTDLLQFLLSTFLAASTHRLPCVGL